VSSSERFITLHLHTFVYGHIARKPKQQQQAPTPADSAAAAANPHTSSSSSSRVSPLSPDAFSTALGSAEAALMAAVVGTDEALAALPGGPVVGGGMQGDPLVKLCFGVLLWQPLRMADVMQWPVWIEKQLLIVSRGVGGRGGGMVGGWTVDKCRELG
jgi:hypothetical protein